MDIYSFIRSRDIAAHCRKIGKVWTPFEMAVIIDRSYRLLAEKHEAWGEIIANYPDMPTPVNDYGGCYDSLHQKLAERIDYHEYLLETFRKPEANAVYRYDDWSGFYRNPDCVFGDFETAFSAAIKYFRLWGDKLIVVRMTKSFINDNDNMTAFFNHDGNLIDITGSRKQTELFPITKNGYPFDAYVAIPMPFKRGDILTYNKGWDREAADTIFALDLFDRDNPEWLEMLSSEKINSDTESVRGFFVEGGGHLCGYDSSYDHDALEYYRGKLKDINRLLRYVSLYLKDDISLPELLALQSRIILEHQLDNYLLQGEINQYILEEHPCEIDSCHDDDVQTVQNSITTEEYSRKSAHPETKKPELSYGIFWVITENEKLDDYKLLCFNVPCDSRGVASEAPVIPFTSSNGKSYSHRSVWDNHVKNDFSHSPYNRKTYTHYPRGRVEISNNTAMIFLSPCIRRTNIINDIRSKFGLNTEAVSKTKVIVEHSANFLYKR